MKEGSEFILIRVGERKGKDKKLLGKGLYPNPTLTRVSVNPHKSKHGKPQTVTAKAGKLTDLSVSLFFFFLALVGMSDVVRMWLYIQ